MSSSSIQTTDGETIATAYYPVNEPKGGVVFVHMMPATKESWRTLARAFQERGYAGLAVDLRGHGESSGGPRGYQQFTDEEHQKSILDLDAAAKWLFGKGIVPTQLAFVGASIGANLSLKYLADHPEIPAAVLLSAGVNYRGIVSEPTAAALRKNQRIFLVSAKDDGENVIENRVIATSVAKEVEKELEIYESGGHGTELLASQSKLQDQILDFITR